MREALGDLVGFVVMWILFIAAVFGSRGLLAITFATYFAQVFYPGGCSPPYSLIRLIAALAIVLLTAIQCYTTKSAVKVTDFLTAGKLTGLLVIIVSGMAYLGLGNTELLEDFTENTSDEVLNYVLAIYSASFAYGGVSASINVVEEIKPPLARNVIASICGSMALITTFYLLTNFAYVSVLTPSEILASDAVAMTFSAKIFSGLFWLMPLFVACSTLGSLNNNIMSISRLTFAAARNGHLPGVFNFIHVTQMTPVPNLLINMSLTIAVIAYDDLKLILVYTGYAGAVINFAAVLSLVVMRFTRKELKRPFTLPLPVPIMYGAILIAMLSELNSLIALGCACVITLFFVSPMQSYRSTAGQSRAASLSA